MSEILREGQVSIKEDGIRSMFFSKRWALLRPNALSFHKNKEVRAFSQSFCVPQSGRPKASPKLALMEYMPCHRCETTYTSRPSNA
jgi:hypothetical protein